jgi:hypothetical protein
VVEVQQMVHLVVEVLLKDRLVVKVVEVLLKDLNHGIIDVHLYYLQMSSL